MMEIIKFFISGAILLATTYCGHRYWLLFKDDTAKGLLKRLGWIVLSVIGMALLNYIN